MVGSYFFSGGATCRILKLYLHYAAMPREKQYQCESRVISSMEALDKSFRQKIAALRCDVRCKFCGDDILLEFYTGGFESLQCCIQRCDSIHPGTIIKIVDTADCGNRAFTLPLCKQKIFLVKITDIKSCTPYNGITTREPWKSKKTGGRQNG